MYRGHLQQNVNLSEEAELRRLESGSGGGGGGGGASGAWASWDQDDEIAYEEQMLEEDDEPLIVLSSDDEDASAPPLQPAATKAPSAPTVAPDRAPKRPLSSASEGRASLGLGSVKPPQAGRAGFGGSGPGRSHAPDVCGRVEQEHFSGLRLRGERKLGDQALRALFESNGSRVLSLATVPSQASVPGAWATIGLVTHCKTEKQQQPTGGGGGKGGGGRSADVTTLHLSDLHPDEPTTMCLTLHEGAAAAHLPEVGEVYAVLDASFPRGGGGAGGGAHGGMGMGLGGLGGGGRFACSVKLKEQLRLVGRGADWRVCKEGKCAKVVDGRRCEYCPFHRQMAARVPSSSRPDIGGASAPLPPPKRLATDASKGGAPRQMRQSAAAFAATASLAAAPPRPVSAPARGANSNSGGAFAGRASGGAPPLVGLGRGGGGAGSGGGGGGAGGGGGSGGASFGSKFVGATTASGDSIQVNVATDPNKELRGEFLKRKTSVGARNVVQVLIPLPSPPTHPQARVSLIRLTD